MNTYTQNSESQTKNIYTFVESKIEKLATALYMVSTYMNDTEPVKPALRTLALTTVQNASHLAHKQSKAEKEALHKDVRHIISLVNLANTIDIMSHMNASILRDEYQKILTLLENHMTNEKVVEISEHVAHTDDQHFYNVLEAKVSQSPAVHVLSERTFVYDETVVEVTSEKQETVQQTQDTPIRQNIVSTFKPFQTNRQSAVIRSYKDKSISTTNESDKKNDRRAAVLSALSSTTPLGIKDIAETVKGCSEKTIQRELNELVLRNKAHRIGDKRWSRYIKVV